jgi:protein involved in polysaccharide export with SLBB domain
MRLLRDSIRNGSSLFALAIISLLLAGCWSQGPKQDRRPATGQSTNATNDLRFDPLRTGDSIRVDFTGTPVAVPYIATTIKGDGTIRLDFIGDVLADGKTPGELEKIIQRDYVPAYYTHLNVTVTPLDRFFYVEGEIGSGGAGGRIPYSGQITLTRAIAAAGGFNPFANRTSVRIYRVDGTIVTVNCKKALKNPKLDLPVYPGDKIVVKRRLW